MKSVEDSVREKLNVSLNRWFLKNEEDADLKKALLESKKMFMANPHFSALAARYGFALKNVKGDGNCFFYALLEQIRARCPGLSALSGTPDYDHTTLRALAVNALLQLHEAGGLREFTENPDEFILRMSTDREWADGLVIPTLAKVLHIKIILINSEGSFPKTPIDCDCEAEATVYLFYQVGLHFQSLEGEYRDSPVVVAPALVEPAVVEPAVVEPALVDPAVVALGVAASVAGRSSLGADDYRIAINGQICALEKRIKLHEGRLVESGLSRNEKKKIEDTLDGFYENLEALNKSLAMASLPPGSASLPEKRDRRSGMSLSNPASFFSREQGSHSSEGSASPSGESFKKRPMKASVLPEFEWISEIALKENVCEAYNELKRMAQPSSIEEYIKQQLKKTDVKRTPEAWAQFIHDFNEHIKLLETLLDTVPRSKGKFAYTSGGITHSQEPQYILYCYILMLETQCHSYEKYILEFKESASEETIRALEDFLQKDAVRALSAIKLYHANEYRNFSLSPVVSAIEIKMKGRAPIELSQSLPAGPLGSVYNGSERTLNSHRLYRR